MRDIILFVISAASCIIIVWESIQAYIRGEYDPNIVRFRQGYEWKPAMMLADAGIMLPIFFVKLPVISYLYLLIIFGTLLLTISILNFKCYRKIRKIGNLIYIIIIDLFFIISIIFISYKLFK